MIKYLAFTSPITGNIVKYEVGERISIFNKVFDIAEIIKNSQDGNFTIRLIQRMTYNVIESKLEIKVKEYMALY